MKFGNFALPGFFSLCFDCLKGRVFLINPLFDFLHFLVADALTLRDGKCDRLSFFARKIRSMP